ncbi:hypothetical protein ACTXT7_005406 [Hymenolepis weldensis]
MALRMCPSQNINVPGDPSNRMLVKDKIWYVEIAELVICAIVVYFAIMMLAFAIVVSKRTRGRNHRNIQEGCIMGGRKTASFGSHKAIL